MNPISLWWKSFDIVQNLQCKILFKKNAHKCLFYGKESSLLWFRFGLSQETTSKKIYIQDMSGKGTLKIQREKRVFKNLFIKIVAKMMSTVWLPLNRGRIILYACLNGFAESRCLSQLNNSNLHQHRHCHHRRRRCRCCPPIIINSTFSILSFKICYFQMPSH